MPRAAIDLGSNSVLLTVMADDGAVLHDEARVVGLGKGLGDGGTFRPDRAAAAADALADYARTAVGFGVPADRVRAVATSSARRASDAHAFFRSVTVRTGLVFRVISGDEEARLTWAGGVSGLAWSGTAAVIDLGGGSTEIAIGGPDLRWKHSFELGSVRLTESLFGDPARPAAEGDLRDLQVFARERFSAVGLPERPSTAIGVAGSVTTLAATALGLSAYNGARVHGSRLTDAMLSDFQRSLIGADAARRRSLFAVSPDRADFLLAGATILRAALEVLELDSLLVSDRGLRYGLLDA